MRALAKVVWELARKMSKLRKLTKPGGTWCMSVGLLKMTRRHALRYAELAYSATGKIGFGRAARQMVRTLIA